MRPEINRYFRAIWSESSEEERELIVANIHEQYMYNINSHDNKPVAIRIHAIYHVSRLPSTMQEQILRNAFDIEGHISVRLSLFFGAIKNGQLTKEDEFYQLLLNDNQYNDANRGYHLAYYDKPNYGSMPFKDEGGDWSNTLYAFLRHFRSSKIEQYFLRRIDLLTLYQFMDSRNSVNPVTTDVLDELERLVFHPLFNPDPKFQQKIEETFQMVKEKFAELCADTGNIL